MNPAPEPRRLGVPDGALPWYATHRSILAQYLYAQDLLSIMISDLSQIDEHKENKLKYLHTRLHYSKQFAGFAKQSAEYLISLLRDAISDDWPLPSQDHTKWNTCALHRQYSLDELIMEQFPEIIDSSKVEDTHEVLV